MPENHNLKRKTSKRLNFNSVEGKSRRSIFFFADTKLQADQTNKKLVANLKKQLFI